MLHINLSGPRDALGRELEGVETAHPSIRKEVSSFNLFIFFVFDLKINR